MVAFPSPRASHGGNPAGVVLEPGDPSPEEMTRTAVRLNPLSETSFVWPGDAAGAYRFRYFAPGGEVDLCGHATAAAYGALALAGELGPLPADVRSVAPGGNVRGRVEPHETPEAAPKSKSKSKSVVVKLHMPVARRVEGVPDLDTIADALGLPVEVITSRPAAAIEDVGIRVLLLPVADLAALDAMRPDFERLRDIGRDDRIVVFYPFVLDAEAGQVRSRSFAPSVAIDEDPATGTAAASLGAYLVREGLVAPPVELRIRQGEAMGRPSELRLEVDGEPGEPTAVRVGGIVRGQRV